MKSPHLNEADKRAVDMLLDELSQSRITAAQGYTATARSIPSPEALDAARSLLSNLDHYEIGEPPADLLTRCMDLIERAPAGHLNSMALPAEARLNA